MHAYIFYNFFLVFWVTVDSENESVSHPVVSDSVWPHGLYPTRLFCPWNSPSRNTGVGCHSLLQGICPTQGSNPALLNCRWILYPLSHQGSLFSLYLPDYKVLEIRGIADFAHCLLLEQECPPLGSSVMENEGSTFENRRLSGNPMQRNQIWQDFSEPLIDNCD